LIGMPVEPLALPVVPAICYRSPRSGNCLANAGVNAKPCAIRKFCNNTINNTEEFTMKRWSAISLALLFAGLTFVWHAQQASGQANAGWVTLFDGSHLNNW